MKIWFRDCKFGRVRQSISVTSFLIAACCSTLAGTKSERFWLAGRYDGNQIIVYFDAVKFNGTLPSNVKKLAPAVAERVFEPFELPASYVDQLQKGPDAEQFALGGKYDLLLDYGKAVTVTITTLVGTETDEEVGNDSFIGGLATVNESDLPYLRSRSYYVLRRHKEISESASKTRRRFRKRTLAFKMNPSNSIFKIRSWRCSRNA